MLNQLQVGDGAAEEGSEQADFAWEDPDAWDDTLLIKAYERAARTRPGASEGAEEGDQGRKRMRTEEPKGQAQGQGQPQWWDWSRPGPWEKGESGRKVVQVGREELSSLLMSWYYAGEAAGLLSLLGFGFGADGAWPPLARSRRVLRGEGLRPTGRVSLSSIWRLLHAPKRGGKKRRIPGTCPSSSQGRPIWAS